MITLTTLDILYITLSIFTAIVWTLLAIVLFRVIKILGPVMEILEYYEKVKSYLSMYSQIPTIIKEKIFEIFSKSTDKSEEEVVKEVKKSKKKKKK